MAAGLDMVAATAAAIKDGAPILNFGAPSSDATIGLTSNEHLTFPILLIDGNPNQQYQFQLIFYFSLQHELNELSFFFIKGMWPNTLLNRTWVFDP